MDEYEAGQVPAPSTSVGPSVKLPQASTSPNLDVYVKNYDYTQLAKAVDAMPPSLDRDYFGGVLANRAGHVPESIAPLTKVLPHVESSRPERAAVALHSLADDYIKTYRYNDAVHAYDELLRKFALQLNEVERRGAKDDYHTVFLFRNTPPQTVSFDGRIELALHRNPVLGTIEATFWTSYQRDGDAIRALALRLMPARRHRLDSAPWMINCGKLSWTFLPNW